MPDPRSRTRLSRRMEKDADAQSEGSSKEIDFSEADKRRDYLKQRLDDILNNIGQSYGKRMADELMKRLQKTVLDFNTEIIAMLDKLEALEEQRQKAAAAEKEPAQKATESGEEAVAESETAIPEDEFANMSEFERRIEMLERQKKQKDAEAKKAAAEAEEKPRKKGLFRRKNK